MHAGDFAWYPPGFDAELRAGLPARMVVIEKPYQPLAGTKIPRFFKGSESEVVPVALAGDADLEVRSLIPADLAFDLAVNTLTFQPGATPSSGADPLRYLPIRAVW